MHHLRTCIAVCAIGALVIGTLAGCSAEPTDSLSLAQPQGTSAAALAPIQTAETPPNHIAQRPSSQSFPNPEQGNDLPLWPPASAASPAAAAPDNPADPLPAFPANPPAFQPPATQPPPGDLAQPQFSPALPAVEPPASDANPLRGAAPMPPEPPKAISPSPIAKPPALTRSSNPLRGGASDFASATPGNSETLLPHAPTDTALGTTAPEPRIPPLPVPPLPASEPVPNLTEVPAAPAAAEPTTETPPQLSALPKPFPKIAVKPAPSRLPRVPINPKAHAEWSAKQKQSAVAETKVQELTSEYEPSGGSAPPSPSEMADMARAYASAGSATPLQPRMMTLGTKQDPPTEAAPPPPPPPLPVPAASAPPAPPDAPTFAPPMFEAPSFAPTQPDSAPAAPESTPPASGGPPMLTSPAAEPLAAQPLMSDAPEAAAETAPESASEPKAPASRAATTALVPPTNSNDPFDVVRVFYGTDRMPTLVNRDTFVMRLIRFTPAAILIILTGIGIGVVLASRKPTWIIGTAALLVFSTLAVWHGISETLEISQLAAQEEPRYSADKSDRGRLERGICEVSIPKTHDPGELEGPSITRLEFKFDPAEHITLRKTVRLQNDAFYEQLQAQVASSPDRELLVFVHGFNVKFEDAARRTAQMAHDLKLQGAPVFFSWPADQYFLLTYGKDETNVAWSAPHLKEFLLDIVHNTDARSINLVAHSMGSRALTTALREIDLQLRDESRLFNQVVLAAPDIDADDFRDNIAPAIQRTAKQVTLYASGNDIALGASRFFHRNARAGDTRSGLVLVPGMHTIDVSNIDGGPWGHSYYGASDPVLRDLHLLLTSLPPERRTWLNMKELDGQTYWAFKPLGTPSTPAMIAPR